MPKHYATGTKYTNSCNGLCYIAVVYNVTHNINTHDNGTRPCHSILVSMIICMKQQQPPIMHLRPANPLFPGCYHPGCVFRCYSAMQAISRSHMLMRSPYAFFFNVDHLPKEPARWKRLMQPRNRRRRQKSNWTATERENESKSIVSLIIKWSRRLYESNLTIVRDRTVH